MRAGKFDKEVEILRPTLASDSHGEEVLTYPAIGAGTKTFAQFVPSPGRERFQSAEIAATAPALFRFRWRTGLIEAQDRLVHGGRIYDVAEWHVAGRHQTIEVLAVARGES